MKLAFKNSALFNKLWDLKNQIIISNKSLPEFIFVERKLFLFAFGTGEITGEMQGNFHKRLCNILNTNSEDEYYIFPLSNEMYHYDEKLPILNFFNFDIANTYEVALTMNFMNKSKESEYSFIRFPDNLLFLSKELNWFIIYTDFLGWSIFGCHDKGTLRVAQKGFKDFIFDEKTLIYELKNAYTKEGQELFIKNYWDLLIRDIT